MRILAIESSTKPVSAALVDDGCILSYTFSGIKLTHSQTLFPIIKSTLAAAKTDFSDIDAIGVATGPGSFTGLRIGIACAKGLAAPGNLKCVGVSTLLAAAYVFKGENAVICPVIDARCGQVYNALFEVCGDTVNRLCDDRAVMIEDLISELESIDKGKKIILCCDAARTVLSAANGQKNTVLAPESLIAQSALGVGLCASREIAAGRYVSGEKLTPSYLKLPQAERELKQRKEVKNK